MDEVAQGPVAHAEVAGRGLEAQKAGQPVCRLKLHNEYSALSSGRCPLVSSTPPLKGVEVDETELTEHQGRFMEVQ